MRHDLGTRYISYAAFDAAVGWDTRHGTAVHQHDRPVTRRDEYEGCPSKALQGVPRSAHLGCQDLHFLLLHHPLPCLADCLPADKLGPTCTSTEQCCEDTADCRNLPNWGGFKCEYQHGLNQTACKCHMLAGYTPRPKTARRVCRTSHKQTHITWQHLPAHCQHHAS